MVDFKLTDEQKEFLSMARDFKDEVIGPQAGNYDESGEYPQELLDKMSELGFTSLNLDEAYGGTNLPLTETAIIFEELSSACAAITLPAVAHSIACQSLILGKADSLIQKNIVNNSSLAALIFSSPSFGYSAVSTQSLIYKKTDSGYYLNGNNLVIANANNGNWVCAIADNQENSNQSICFALPISKLPKPKAKMQQLGLRSSNLMTIDIADLHIDQSDLVLNEKQEIEQNKLLSFQSILLASLCVGIARLGLTNALNYGKERSTFGQPLVKHQAIAFILAEMHKNVTAAQYLIRQASYLYDQNQDSLCAALKAKSFAQDIAEKSAIDAVQVYGGYGYSREYPVEKLMRDSKCMHLLGGNSAALDQSIGKMLLACK